MIHPFQNAFAEGRDIQDNILIAHEVIPFFHVKKGNAALMALKLQMWKAYDKLSWNFIENTHQFRIP